MEYGGGGGVGVGGGGLRRGGGLVLFNKDHADGGKPSVHSGKLRVGWLKRKNNA